MNRIERDDACAEVELRGCAGKAEGSPKGEEGTHNNNSSSSSMHRTTRRTTDSSRGGSEEASQLGSDAAGKAEETHSRN